MPYNTGFLLNLGEFQILTQKWSVAFLAECGAESLVKLLCVREGGEEDSL